MSDFGSNFVNAFSTMTQLQRSGEQFKMEKEKINQGKELLSKINSIPSTYKDVDGDTKYVPMTQRLQKIISEAPENYYRPDVVMGLAKTMDEMDAQSFNRTKWSEVGAKFDAMTPEQRTPANVGKLISTAQMVTSGKPDESLMMKTTPDYGTLSVPQGTLGTKVITFDKNAGQNPLTGTQQQFGTAQTVNINANDSQKVFQIDSNGNSKEVLSVAKGMTPAQIAKMGEQQAKAQGNPALLSKISSLWGQFANLKKQGLDEYADQVLQQIYQIDSAMTQQGSPYAAGISKQSPRLNALWQNKVMAYGDNGSMEKALQANKDEIWQAYIEEYGGDKEAAKNALFNDWKYIKNGSATWGGKE